MRRTTGLFALTLCTLLASSAHAAGPRKISPSATKKVSHAVKLRPKSAINTLYATRAAALALWAKYKPLYSRVEGTITIDDAVQPYLLGSCSDIVVRSYDGQLDSNHVIGTVKAFGDLASGQCQYVLYMKPNSDTRMFSWYDGPTGSNHPGDYLEVNPAGAQPFAVTVGGTSTFDFELSYDWIK